MKKKILSVILIFLIILALVVTAIYIYFNRNKSSLENKSNLINTESTEISKTREFNGLKFSDANLSSDGKSSKYSVVITNETDKDIELGKWNIVFKDKNNAIVGELVGYISETIKAKESVNPTIEAKVDLSKAYSVEYKEYVEKNDINEETNEDNK